MSPPTVRRVTTTTTKNASTISGEAPAVNPVHLRNRDLRQRYVALCEELTSGEIDDKRRRRVEAALDGVAGEFIKANAALAATVARQSAKRPSDFEELYQQGLTELWDTFLTWDPDRGTFANYAMFQLKGNVQRLKVKMGRNETYTNFTARPELIDAITELAATLGRSPSNEEVAAKTGFTKDRVAQMRRAQDISLATPTGEDMTIADLIPPMFFDTTQLSGDDVEKQWLENLSDVTKDLTPLETFVLLRHHGLDGAESEGFQQLASRLGLGREQLRRAENAAIDKINARGLVVPTPL